MVDDPAVGSSVSITPSRAAVDAGYAPNDPPSAFPVPFSIWLA